MSTVQALIIRTTEATIDNYHAHCKVDPAASAPITRSIQQRKRPLSPLTYAAPAQANISFQLDHQLLKPSRWDYHTSFLDDLSHLWNNIQVAKQTEDVSGITWIELFILFEIRTGLRTPSDVTKPRFVLQPVDRSPTIQDYLRSFKTATLKILRQASGNPELKEILATNQITNQRLRSLGTASICAGTSFNTTVNDEEARTIAHSLLKIIRKTTSEDLGPLYGGRLWKTLRAISLKKPPNWRLHNTIAYDDGAAEDGGGSPPPDPPDEPRPDCRIGTGIVPYQLIRSTPSTGITPTNGQTTPASADQPAFRIRCQLPCDNVHLRATKPRFTVPKPKGVLYARITCNRCNKSPTVTNLLCDKCATKMPDCKCIMSTHQGIQ